jgi:hypothetical protein
LITDTGELLVETNTPAQGAPFVDPKQEIVLESVREALDAELLDDFALFRMRVRGEALGAMAARRLGGSCTAGRVVVLQKSLSPMLDLAHEFAEWGGACRVAE